MSITLVTQETMYHSLAQRALTETLKHIDVTEVVTFSDKEILPGAKLVHVDHFPNVSEYCEFMLRGMLEHINTDHILFVQWDAMAYNKAAWTDDFLKYDYIGAPWPWYPVGKNVGNGGFSLRSRRLLEALQDTKIQMDPAIPEAVNEDQVIGNYHRPYLEQHYGIKYPETGIAAQFSFELGQYYPSFGFHGPWNVIKLSDMDTIDFYINNMNYQGWNIHKWHHLLFELVARSCFDHIPYAIDQLWQHSPDLVLPVLEWLAKEQAFWTLKK